MQSAASRPIGERLFGREICETAHGAFPAAVLHSGLAGNGHVSFRVFFFGGFGACQCLSSTTSIGSRRTHLPSVKSGIACGAPPCAIEASDSTETHIHAAAS